MAHLNFSIHIAKMGAKMLPWHRHTCNSLHFLQYQFYRRNVTGTKLDNKSDEIRWQKKQLIFTYTQSALGFYFTWRYMHWIDSLKLIPLKRLHMCLFIKMFHINLLIHRTSQPNEITSRPNALILSSLTVTCMLEIVYTCTCKEIKNSTCSVHCIRILIYM